MAEIYLRSGSAVYQARVRIDGVVKRISTGERSPIAAQQKADALEQQLTEAQIKPGDLTVTEAAARFFREHPKPLKPRTVLDYKNCLANVVEHLGDFPVRLLTEEKLREYINWKLARHTRGARKGARSGHVSLRRDLAFLSSLYSTARHWDCGITSNPGATISKKGLANARSRDTWLQPEDVDRLVAACTKEEHKRFIILAVYTGMRHQELLKLSWDEINLKKKTIFLDGRRTKNSSSREIPLMSAALNTLLSTPEHSRYGYVFKGKDGESAMFQMGRRWQAIRTRAGLPDVRIHDLRHTFASWLKQRGVAETTIMDLMGHKTRSMVQRYSHESPESRRRAVTVLETHF